MGGGKRGIGGGNDVVGRCGGGDGGEGGVGGGGDCLKKSKNLSSVYSENICKQARPKRSFVNIKTLELHNSLNKNGLRKCYENLN